MRKVTFKRVVSLALATAMAASVCITALADDAVTEPDAAPAVSESVQAEPELAAASEAADSQAESEPEQAETQPESQAQTVESAPEQQEESVDSEPAAETAQSEAAEQIAVFAQEEETTQLAATVNGQEYDSLQAAFDAASEGTVRLQRDIDLQETATVAEGKKITLDLNGHKVHGGSDHHSENGSHFSAIAVKGSLTIQDNGTAGEIYNESSDSPTHGVCLESAHAELIVESGKISSTAYAVYAPVGTVIVNGGTIESTGMSALVAGNNGNVIIYNGEIKSDKAWYGDAPIRLSDAAQLTIYGGKVSANSYADDYKDIYTNENSSAKISISGGSFGKEPLPEQIAAGYEAVEKDGLWAVQKFEPIATVNGIGYKTLQAAFAAAKNNEVITLAKDTTENIAVPAGVDYILNLNAHTLTGTITIPEKGVLAVKGGSMAAASEEAVLFDNSGLLRIVDGNYAAKNLFKASENAKIEVEHGYFGAKVDAKYLVEGTICKQIGNADQRYPFVVTPCAPSDVKTETKKPTSKVEENKELGENADAAAKAAESIKVAESSESAVQAAAEAKAKVSEDTLQQAIKALGEKNPEVIASDVRIVTKPGLTVKPTAMEKGKSITFEISLNYTLEATDGTNTIELETQPITDLEKEIEISLGDVSAAGIAVSGNDTVYIKHIHNGEVSFYAADSTIANGTLATVSFKTKGFSPFTLLVSPSVSVDVNGTSVSLDPGKIDQNLADLLPYAARDGYYVTGWTFTAGSQTLTTQKMQLTAALFSDLLDLAAGGTVSMTPEYTKNSSGSSSSSSSGSSYVAPDDSVYYTCVKCGYHDWTATANGYQCDHCGYLEVVKQIAGYERVKGVCEPAAVAQSKAASAAVTTATSPKTGDASNLALAVAALAASLLGAGALLVLRKKNH